MMCYPQAPEFMEVKVKLRKRGFGIMEEIQIKSEEKNYRTALRQAGSVTGDPCITRTIRNGRRLSIIKVGKVIFSRLNTKNFC